jgi:subfamily B ATP-binding cassette protein MsbA
MKISNWQAWQAVKRILPFLKPLRSRAILGILFIIPASSMDATLALLLKPYTDNAMVVRDIKYSLYIPVAIVFLTILQGVLNYLATYFNAWVAQKLTMSIKKELYTKLLSQSPSYFDKASSGTILQRYSSDADIACTGFIDNIKNFLSRLFTSLFLLGVLLYHSWELAIIAVLALGFSFIPISIVRRKIKEYTTKNIKNVSQIVTRYNETFSGNRTIFSYNLHDQQKNKFEQTLNDLFSVYMKVINHTKWLSPVMHVIMSIGVAAVIGVGSLLIMKGTITPGGFMSFIAALVMLYNPIKAIGNNFVNVQNSLLAIDRIFEILDEQIHIDDNIHGIELKEVKGEIKFSHVTFSYDGTRDVLHDINFKTEVGKSLAIVGNSGGGKSTLISLIPRFYNLKEGSITVDGVDITKFTLTSLRDKIAMVFQDNFLFSGTIAENIMLGKPNASQKEVDEAIENAHLTDFIKTLPEGINTQIGERGVTLSGGQKQRVAIARAFLKNAPIVILDEATSALDNKSEAVVQQALDDLMKNRTVFVIAHRLSTIVKASKIIVINDGKIVEEGTHSELLEREDGAYKSLYMAQFKK